MNGHTQDRRPSACVRLKVEPYPYQKEGIASALERKRLIIGDEPGLGKTLQAIGTVEAAGAYPCLVICPSALKINWQREFMKFTGREALVPDGSTATVWPYLLRMGTHCAAIVNYESLRKFFVWDIRSRRKEFSLRDVVFSDSIGLFRSVIIDESHRVKDPSTQQSKFAKGICTGKEYILLLSGTPVVNRPEDLVAQLSIMDRLSEFGGRAAFLSRYGQGHNLGELSERLYASCMIRREKREVLTQLPDKRRCDLHVEISNREEYEAAEKDLESYLREYRDCTDAEIRRKMRMKALVRFMELRSLSSKGKVERASEFVRLFLESGRQLIVFCSLHEVADMLTASFPGSVRVTGRDSMAEKQAAVDAFQQGRAKLIVCSIKAAGVGLTLTAASDVAFVEFPWTYADCCQCEDRAHRIGQKESVTCYYLIGEGTIDACLYRIIQEKRGIAREITASQDEVPEDRMYFEELSAGMFPTLWSDGDVQE